MDTLDTRIFQKFGQYNVVRWSDERISLRSGGESHVYVSGREDFTDHPDLLEFLGLKMAVLVSEQSMDTNRQPCCIGIPTAGPALAQAASMVSQQEKKDPYSRVRRTVCFRTMREVVKSHGLHADSWMNGVADVEHHTYWLVDNAITTGASVQEARAKLLESGYPTEDISVFLMVDLQQGGVEKLREVGFSRIVVAYTIVQIVEFLTEAKHWPNVRLEQLRKDIQVPELV